MSTLTLLRITWRWEPSVLIGCLFLAVGYVYLSLQAGYRGLGWFVLGDMLLCFALVGPLDVLGDTYLFSAHMAQHLVLVLLVPPGLLMGLVPVLHGLPRPLWRLAAVMADHPVIAWVLHVATVWIWHVPRLYEATLHHEATHIFEHLCFLVTAVIFWWAVIAPDGLLQHWTLMNLLYLLAATGASTVLGIILVFAPVGLYPSYLMPHDTLRILPFIRGAWGLTPDVDQQLAGLLMWVPGGLVYLLAMLGVMARWYNGPQVHISRPESSMLQGGGTSDA